MFVVLMLLMHNHYTTKMTGFLVKWIIRTLELFTFYS